jgi:hypothetical protein
MITRVVNGKLQMRCLVLKQPYLHLIFDLPVKHRKNIENRTRPVTSEMGPMLMSASKSMGRDYFEEACDGAIRRGVPEALLPKFSEMERGVLYGCVRFHRRLPTTSLEDSLWKWKFPAHTGYVLGAADAIRLPPRPVSGALGIFYVELTEEERELLRAAGMLS